MIYIHLHRTLLTFYLYLFIDSNYKVIAVNALQDSLDFLSFCSEHFNFFTNVIQILLLNFEGLAKTSSRPGKTQLINHFLINKQWYLVDLPGYGYAQTSKSSRQHWQKMTEQYMLHREALTNVYVLVDSRIEPRPIDLEFINFLGANGIPLSIVFTKTDGEKQREVSANINRFKSALLQQWEELPDILLTSSSTGYGRDALLNHIEQINKSLVSD